MFVECFYVCYVVVCVCDIGDGGREFGNCGFVVRWVEEWDGREEYYGDGYESCCVRLFSELFIYGGRRCYVVEVGDGVVWRKNGKEGGWRDGVKLYWIKVCGWWMRVCEIIILLVFVVIYE